MLLVCCEARGGPRSGQSGSSRRDHDVVSNFLTYSSRSERGTSSPLWLYAYIHIYDWLHLVSKLIRSRGHFQVYQCTCRRWHLRIVSAQFDSTWYALHDQRTVVGMIRVKDVIGEYFIARRALGQDHR